MFGLFNKLDAATEGTAIGLAIAKRIIEYHGGRIWVKSQGASKETTFFLRSPIKINELPLWEFVCAGEDLNLHVLRHTHLKRACLPIPAPARKQAVL